jgi:Ca2+-binding RTX toxin-like protein
MDEPGHLDITHALHVQVDDLLGARVHAEGGGVDRQHPGDEGAHGAGLDGTEGPDVLIGNKAANELDGGGGADWLIAGGGADSVEGGRGNDRISGGKGRDLLIGAGGADRIRSRGGSPDQVSCGSASDTVRADRRDRVGADCERVRR